MQHLYLAGLSFPTIDSTIIMGFFASFFALTIVGALLYLYVAGACQVPHMRPFRFTMYLLLLICAMTLSIGIIQQTPP
jgi:hypothetical protein